MEKLIFFNTLTRKKEEFKPIQDKIVKMYTCGLTVYDYAHIGNLRTYIFEDILKRVLLYNGSKVKHIENITDVGHLVSDADVGEDKMMKALKREGLKPIVKSLLKLADKYSRAFLRDKKYLNILPPTKYPRATEHIPEIIALIKKIEKNGYTYQISDGLYFDTSKFQSYGQLSGMNLEKLVGYLKSRIESNPEKKSPTDFALWLKAIGKNKNHVMQWSSPWGRGFPGWHIECSAMSMKYLGEHFDIHCGGIDHVPIHHTNEIAQNEGATGHKTVNWWLHGEFLILGKEKMAKSASGFVTLKDLINRGFCPLSYRYLCLGTHYRQKLNFSWQGLKGAQNALFSLWENLREYEGRGEVIKEYQEKFLKTINDDLNMPKALALVWDLIKSKEKPLDKKATLLDFDRVLGLGLKKIKKIKIPKEIKQLADKREKLRQQKKWSEADKVREEIEKRGFIIEDTPQGPKIKKVSH